jgi:DNA recombination protein Rad52
MKDSMTAATEKFEEPTIAEIRKQLDAKIPRSAVSLRDGGGPKKLSYLEGWYVIARLNEVLGQGNWSYEIASMQLVHSGEVNGKQSVHYIAQVMLKAHLGNGQDARQVYFSDVGYGDGTDKYNIGKAHELAAKEAVTDAVKRCAKNLGMSLGLALYDKSQENVDDEEKPETVQAGGSKDTKAAAMGPVRSNSAETVSPGATQSAIGPYPKGDRKLGNTKIGDLAVVFTKRTDASGKRLGTMGDLKTHLETNYKVTKKEELTDEQAEEFYNFLARAVSGR